MSKKCIYCCRKKSVKHINSDNKYIENQNNRVYYSFYFKQEKFYFNVYYNFDSMFTYDLNFKFCPYCGRKLGDYNV